MRKTLLSSLLLFALPLFACGQWRAVDDSLRAKYCKEVDFIIDNIENMYISGRRGLSDEEWNRRVKMIYDKVDSCKNHRQYLFALRYTGLLTKDAHFKFIDNGIYNRFTIFKENDTIFPLWVKTWKDGGVYTVKDYTGKIPKDARIISVNGYSATDMALFNRMLSPYEDLYAMAWMNSQEEPGPRSSISFCNFLFMEGINAPYKIEYIENGYATSDTVTLQGMTREEIFKVYKGSWDKHKVKKRKGFRNRPVKYENAGDGVGVLTINMLWGKSYSELMIFSKDWRYMRLLKPAMRRIARDNIEDLIIDVGINPGGMKDNVYKTLNYFTDDTIDVADVYYITDDNRKLTKIRASLAYEFTDITKDQMKQLLGVIDSAKAGTIVCADTLFKVQFKPNQPKHRFKGNVYLLTSNLSYSATQEFAQHFKELKIGHVAGQPCGGYNFISSGNINNILLPYLKAWPMGIPTGTSKSNLRTKIYDYDPVDIPIEHPFEDWLKDENNSQKILINMIKSKKPGK